jgi:hypothetical protein
MNIDNNFVWILVLLCVVPAALAILIFAWIIRQGKHMFTPDLAQLQARFDELQTQNPNASRDVLVARIIQNQAIRAGIVGAVTSVGGVWFLPIELPLDLFFSARVHTATMHFLAWAYGIRDEDRVLNLGELLALPALDFVKISPDMVGQWQTQFAGRMYRRIAVLVLEKSFAKLIPGLGLIVGFVVNYFSARLFARLASAYYATQAGKNIVQGKLV